MPVLSPGQPDGDKGRKLSYRQLLRLTKDIRQKRVTLCHDKAHLRVGFAQQRLVTSSPVYPNCTDTGC